MAKKAKDTTSIGFEEKIWKAADILRGTSAPRNTRVWCWALSS